MLFCRQSFLTLRVRQSQRAFAPRVRTHDEAFGKIEQIRRQLDLDTVADGGTIAYMPHRGSVGVGYNSGQQGDGTKALRQLFFSRMKRHPEFKDLAHVGKSKAINHAEAMSLYRAYRKSNGTLPKKLTMYVDRPTCAGGGSCVNLLPAVVRELGIEELTIFYRTPKGLTKSRLVTPGGTGPIQLIQ